MLSLEVEQIKALHIQYDICSHHGEEHGHFRDKLNQRIFQVFLNFHMYIVEAACYPSLRWQQPEAEIQRTNFQD